MAGCAGRPPLGIRLFNAWSAWQCRKIKVAVQPGEKNRSDMQLGDELARANHRNEPRRRNQVDLDPALGLEGGIARAGLHEKAVEAVAQTAGTGRGRSKVADFPGQIAGFLLQLTRSRPRRG